MTHALTMPALQRARGAVALRTLEVPTSLAPDALLVRVSLAGLCRTDVCVADGLLASREGVVLGHEGVGTVAAVGEKADPAWLGARVSFDPRGACGVCSSCVQSAPAGCSEQGFLGVARDGVFAGYAQLPASRAVRVPGSLSERRAAYVEPVAAALAVTRGAGLYGPSSRVLVHGDNRIARLTELVLRASGYADVTRVAVGALEGAHRERFEAAIETVPTALDELLEALRPGGVLVLKSRLPGRVPLELGALVRREIAVRSVYYGDFARAVELLGDPGFEVEPLLGEVHPLSAWSEVFEGARRGEQAKVFFDPWG